MGLNGAAGIGVTGAAATGSHGGGMFYSPTTGFNSGTFTTGGADAYVGTTPVSTVAGLSGSGGPSFYFTNAQSVQQLSGPFITNSFDIGYCPLQVGVQVAHGRGHLSGER